MEIIKTFFSDTNGVKQNTDSVFEMTRKRFHAIHFIISVLTFSIIVYIMLTISGSSITGVYDRFTSTGFSSFLALSQANQVVWFIIGYIILSFIIWIAQGFRIGYFRIDSMQLQTKTLWQSRLGHEGKTYFLTNPATIETEMIGFGKNKHYKIVYTSTGGEKTKIKLWGQIFGSGSLNLLEEWVKNSKITTIQ